MTISKELLDELLSGRQRTGSASVELCKRVFWLENGTHMSPQDILGQTH